MIRVRGKKGVVRVRDGRPAKVPGEFSFHGCFNMLLDVEHAMMKAHSDYRLDEVFLMGGFTEFCDDLKDKATELLVRDGVLQPVFFIIEDDGKVDVLPDLMPSRTGYDFLCESLRSWVKQHKATALVHIGSGWIVVSKEFPDVDAEGYIPPADRPDRVECLMVEGASLGGRYVYAQKFHRDNGKVVLDEVLHLDGNIGVSRLLDGLFDTIQ